MLKREFNKISIPAFNFVLHETVQIGDIIFATSHNEVKVTKIENLLSKNDEVKTTALASLYQYRASHSTCTYMNKSLFVAGGTSGAFFGSCLSAVNRFDFETNQFHDAPPLNEPRMFFGTFELNGSVYAVGGYSGKGIV